MKKQVFAHSDKSIDLILYIINKFVYHYKTKSTNFMSFLKRRDDWPHHENSSCSAEEISLIFFPYIIFTKRHLESVFMIFMYNLKKNSLINLVKSLLETLVLKLASIMRRFLERLLIDWCQLYFYTFKI